MSNGWETDNVKGKWRETPDGQCKNKKCPCKSHIDDGYDYASIARRNSWICPWCQSLDRDGELDEWSTEYSDQGSQEFDVLFVLNCMRCGCLFDGNDVFEAGNPELKTPTIRQKKGYEK